jgi:hypothetical protein
VALGDPPDGPQAHVTIDDARAHTRSHGRQRPVSFRNRPTDELWRRIESTRASVFRQLSATVTTLATCH